MEFFTRISKNSVPGFRMLDDYEWVNAFCRCREIQEELAVLRLEKRKIKKANPNRESLMELAEEQFEQYKNDRIQFIRRYFSHKFRGEGSFNVFKHLLYHSDSDGWPPYISLEEVMEAIEGIEFPEDAIGRDDKKKKLEQMDLKIAELKTELSELSPPFFFRLEGGAVCDDIRQTFFEFWWKVQNRCKNACGPQGIDLYKSSEAEKQAWNRLGLKDAVNPKAIYSPAPGE